MLFNWVKTAMLMAAIMALFGIIGGMLGGQSGMLLALLFGGDDRHSPAALGA